MELVRRARGGGGRGGRGGGGVGTERRAGGVGVSSGSRGRGRGGSVAADVRGEGAVRRGVRDRGHRGELLRRQGGAPVPAVRRDAVRGGAARGNAGEEGRDQGEREARTPRVGTEARRGARGRVAGEIPGSRARTASRSRAHPSLIVRPEAEGEEGRGRRSRPGRARPEPAGGRRATRCARGAFDFSSHPSRPEVSASNIGADPFAVPQERRRENITSSEGRVHSSSEPAPGPARVRRWRRIPSPRGYASRLVALDAAPGVLASPRAPRTKHAPRSTVSPPFHLPRSRRNASRRRTRRRTSAARSKSWTRRGASILVARATVRLAPRALYSRIPPTTHTRTSRRDTQGRQDRPGRARVGVPGAQAQDQEGTRARALTPSSRPFDRRSPHRRDPRLNPSPRSLLSSSRTSRT